MYKDFDQMFAQMKGEGAIFRIYGKEYSIPRDLPASLVLELARCEGDVPPRLVFSAAERIFGREILNELCSHGDFTLSRLEAMLEWAFAMAGGGEGEGSEAHAKN